MEGSNPAVKQMSTPAKVGVASPSAGDASQALPIKAAPLEAIDSAAGSASSMENQFTPQASGTNPSATSSPKADSRKPIAESQPPKPPQPSTPPPEVSEDEEGDTDIELPDLSPECAAFMSSKRYVESDAEIKQNFGLSDEDVMFLNEMDHAVFGGLINLTQYVSALREEFPKLNKEEKDKLIAELLADRYVPFGVSLTPSAETLAREQKLALPSASYYRIYTKPLTYMGAANEAARSAGITLMGQTQERLRDIIVSRVKGVRTDAQVEDQLKRSQEMGGLGLRDEQAHAAAAAIADISSRARLVTEEEYSSLLSRELRGTRKEAEQTTVAPEAKPLVTTPEQQEEEKEIADIISKMPKAEQDNATVLASSIRNVLERLSWRPEDPYLQRRFTNMISTRLRDVRSRNEFFMKLMRDVKVGGLGLDRKEAEKVTDEVEEGYNAFRGNIEKEEKEKLRKQLEAQERKVEERKQREAAEHAKWFQDKIKSKQTEEAKQKRAFEQLKVIMGGQTSSIEHPVEAKEKARERAAFGKLVPAPELPPAAKKPREAAAPLQPPRRPHRFVPGAASEQTARERKKAEPAVPRKVATRPIVKVSAATVRMGQASAGLRPKMEDVRAPESAPGLAGPLQEIGNLTLSQFRRLGSPEEAAKRVREKVELLAEESFERRLAGIQAWQRSPLQKRYLALLAEAFKAGKRVQALVEEKQQAKEEVLSQEELDAIMGLNNALRL